MIERGRYCPPASEREIILNLATGLPFTLKEEDLRRLIGVAERSGVSSFSLLPFRALDNKGAVDLLGDWSRLNGFRVTHIEDTWNSHDCHFSAAVLLGVWGHLRRIGGDQSEPPILQDAFLLGGKRGRSMVGRLMEKFPEAKYIAYQNEDLGRFPSGRTLVAISPLLGLEMPQQVVDFARENEVAGLVFDSSHPLPDSRSVSYSDRPTRPVDSVLSQFAFFAERGLVKLVDIHPSGEKPLDILRTDRLRDFRRRQGPMFELTQAAGEHGLDSRIEIIIPLSDVLLGRRGLLGEVTDILRTT